MSFTASRQRLGADVPFFLRAGSQLGTGDGTELAAIELPADYRSWSSFPPAR